MDDSIRAEQFPRKAARIGRQFNSSGILSGETEQVGGRESRWKHGSATARKLLDGRWVRSTHTKGGLPPPVIRALAQTFNLIPPRKTRQRLSDRRARHVAEVLETPQAFAAPLYTSADGASDAPWQCI
jgi:hypothetical protein